MFCVRSFFIFGVAMEGLLICIIGEKELESLLRFLRHLLVINTSGFATGISFDDGHPFVNKIQGVFS